MVKATKRNPNAEKTDASIIWVVESKGELDASGEDTGDEENSSAIGEVVKEDDVT